MTLRSGIHFLALGGVQPQPPDPARAAADEIVASHWVHRDDSEPIEAIIRKHFTTAIADESPFDFQRFHAWLCDPNRKPAAIAFTAGPERLAADAVELSGVIPHHD